MLQPKHTSLFSRGNQGFMRPPDESAGIFYGFGLQGDSSKDAADSRPTSSMDEAAETDDPDAPLDDAARSEREYVRQRLREELKREPTESELDEWLRQHTEGY